MKFLNKRVLQCYIVKNTRRLIKKLKVKYKKHETFLKKKSFGPKSSLVVLIKKLYPYIKFLWKSYLFIHLLYVNTKKVYTENQLFAIHGATFVMENYEVRHLSPTTPYMVEVCAYNNAGNGPCQRASATTQPSGMYTFLFQFRGVIM